MHLIKKAGTGASAQRRPTAHGSAAERRLTVAHGWLMHHHEKPDGLIPQRRPLGRWR